MGGRGGSRAEINTESGASSKLSSGLTSAIASGTEPDHTQDLNSQMPPILQGPSQSYSLSPITNPHQLSKEPGTGQTPAAAAEDPGNQGEPSPVTKTVTRLRQSTPPGCPRTSPNLNISSPPNHNLDKTPESLKTGVPPTTKAISKEIEDFKSKFDFKQVKQNLKKKLRKPRLTD